MLIERIKDNLICIHFFYIDFLTWPIFVVKFHYKVLFPIEEFSVCH